MTLFVGGVHAVGKTFVLRPVCESLGIRHATASQLIKEQRGFESWTESKQVNDIDENQRALVAAVARLEEGGETVVLDGHFVLRRDVSVHEAIGVPTFLQLRMRGAILLDAASETVAERLRQRSDFSWTTAEIDELRRRERQHAEAVCRELEVQMACLYMPSDAEVRDVISQMLL